MNELMGEDFDLRLGLAIALLSSLPVIGIILLTEVRKFAGMRKKLASGATRILPFAVIEPFQRVYGSESVRIANQKALLAAKKRGQAEAKALRRNNIRKDAG